MNLFIAHFIAQYDIMNLGYKLGYKEDVKCDPEMGIHMRKQDGILPAYHMNHAQWLSILLDGTVPLKTVCNLLDISYELTLPKKKRRNNKSH